MCLPPGNLPAWRCWGRQEKSNHHFQPFPSILSQSPPFFSLNTSAGHVFFCEKISFHPLPQNLNPNLTSTPPTKTPKTKHPNPPSSLGWRTSPPNKPPSAATTNERLPGYQGQFSAARYNSQSLLGLGEVTDLLGSLGAPGVDVEMWGGKGTGVWRGLWGSIGVDGIWRNLAKGWDVS